VLLAPAKLLLLLGLLPHAPPGAMSVRSCSKLLCPQTPKKQQLLKQHLPALLAGGHGSSLVRPPPHQQQPLLLVPVLMLGRYWLYPLQRVLLPPAARRQHR
jgi:hypothetical protein